MTSLGIAEELFTRSGESRTFAASLQIEVSLLGLSGLAMFVIAAVRIRRVARQRIGELAIVLFLILSAGSLTYITTTSVISSAAAAGVHTATQNITPVLVKIVGGPISQSGDYYEPVNIKIVIGVNNSVTWSNVDASHHTVTDLNRVFESGNINPEQTYTYYFMKPGVYFYVCDYHPWMKGVVIVRGS